MFTTTTVSPLDLHLDEENPRFRIKVNPSQDNIREYMLKHENILRLANKMVEMNTLLPGERIIIYSENGKNIVLEGNRRTSIYQMLLNRKLIPASHVNSYPSASKEFLEKISKLSVDVVKTRQEAMPYLAARHIEGVRKWSSVSKWRISYECFKEGRSIQEISEYLILPLNTIKTNICNYKILLRGINDPTWTEEEKKLLSPLEIKPDKLIRLFRLSETTQTLGLYFDDNYDLKSSYISDTDINNIIKELTRRAFIDNTLNTRSKFNDIREFIEKDIPSNTGENKEAHFSQKSKPAGSTSEKTSKPSVPKNNESETTSQQDKNPINQPGTGGKANLPYFFNGLKFGHLSADDPLTHGVTRISYEIKRFSDYRLVRAYPISAAFLTRALIEHSLIYYAKKNHIQGQERFIWEHIQENGFAPKLSKIINKYTKNLPNYITESTVRDYFENLFSKYDETANPLNWVIHRPDEFVISPEMLINLPAQGLLRLINYLIR